ncbi:flagellar basal body rod protein FlgC [Caminibacter mediatlanticus TB-2]|uniref:Flagellar basal-body rod protein FlgC n=1 Tax=Caminibacter mediatlanticus TB-2 TaxID=391592 RepID=A0AAI9AFI9_9BACT|nr:flagellar basal body rod protein FlgC [Caminibacter mediatlanticus]EDM23216.1 flagellar basal-body rod protein C [Caminibacter mediatlanticus TB-2]QCT93904.1 flagellar basal body rod protein FlgC [Caminibacter mediatlanticus TB-2]
MAFLNSFDISGYGLSAQRFRINIISENIANANTTRTPEGGPYRRKEVIFKAIPFEDILNKEIENSANFHKYENPLDEEGEDYKVAKPPIETVIVDKIVRDDSKPILKYEPDNPDANADGYVAYPNINPVIEMADLIEATRSYQANVAAFQSAKNMAQSAINILQA